jgi:hypothetical protein
MAAVSPSAVSKEFMRVGINFFHTFVYLFIYFLAALGFELMA